MGWTNRSWSEYCAYQNAVRQRQQGRAAAIDECITLIKQLHDMYDVVAGDWSCCHQIITELEALKEEN